jgi:2-polyprenyl-6-methoxyphenol hydroxylase-like FAD-dependent oxidoreductase
LVDAIVVGGAVAGLAAARALAGSGAHVQVVERRPVGVAEGAGLVIYPAAWRALERLGAVEAFRSVAVPLDGMTTYDETGKVLHFLDTRRFEERYGYPLAGVHRADLLTALQTNIQAELLSGVEFTGLEVGDRVKALTDSEPLYADVVVGADGIRSRVREALGLPFAPRQSGYVAWRGIAPEAPAGFSTSTAGIVVGAGRHGGWVSVGGGRVYWFLTGDQGEASGHNTALERVRAWRGPLPDLIAATEPDSILFNDLIDRDPDTHWGSGPVTLAGDAAHAMLPSMAQGANQALEDAAVLMRAVTQHGVNASAFRAYEASRQKRTGRLVRMSRQMMPVFNWRRAPARRLRAALLALPSGLTQWQLEWLYRGDS